MPSTRKPPRCVVTRPHQLPSVHALIQQVLNTFYALHATPAQKKAIVVEFYGPEYSLFKGQVLTLEEIIAREPQKKKLILGALKTYLMDVANKASAVLSHGVLHVPLLKFLEHAPYADVGELLPFMRDHIARLVHTKEGARAACLLIGYGKPKDRKVMAKAVKGLVPRIARDEYGHIVLVRLPGFLYVVFLTF